MKNLVLGVLLAAAASSAACTSADSGGVPVSWRFTKLENNTTLGCPAGFNTARIVSQAVDDTTHIGAGEQITDLFDCSAGHGTIALPNDAFLIWVEIESASGTLYAQSQETYYDTALDNFVVDAEIIDDGGFFFLEWDLFDSVTGRLMSCADGGVTGGNSAIDVVSTEIGNSTNFQDDRYDCTDHYGATDPLLAGSYTIQVQAFDSANQHAGSAPEILNKTIRAPGGYTDLGLVHIPID
jgi:hypothetical protein